MERGPRYIEEAIEPQIVALGFSLVRVKLFGGRRQVLQVMIERADGGDVNVDECAQVSRSLSPLIDVLDPISDAYALEVSSPGIDRPLTRHADFERYVGFEVKVELSESLDGRRRYRGVLHGLTDAGHISLTVDGEDVAFALGTVQSAKLVLTDALIAAHQAAEPVAMPADEGVV